MNVELQRVLSDLVSVAVATALRQFVGAIPTDVLAQELKDREDGPKTEDEDADDAAD